MYHNMIYMRGYRAKANNIKATQSGKNHKKIGNFILAS